jgi:ribosomal protein L44E
MIKKKRKNEANAVTPRERKRIRRIREKYKNVSKPLPEQEVITKIAVLQLLSRISGLNHFDRS